MHVDGAVSENCKKKVNFLLISVILIIDGKSDQINKPLPELICSKFNRFGK